jgi:uncharacterized metal-binding protein YceD (DUF177 family)
MTKVEHAAHGFRRLVAVAKVGPSGLVQTVEAKSTEYEKIAEYLDLIALHGLRAEIALAPWRGKGLRLTGSFKADVTQACVVTLDPVEAHIEAEFERRFLPDETLDRETKDQSHDVFVDPDGEDPAEPLTREIDLGEILIEELALNLEPYPRKAGVDFKADEVNDPKESPFAKLAKLKPKLVEKKG